jgi:hypothetical protein
MQTLSCVANLSDWAGPRPPTGAARLPAPLSGLGVSTCGAALSCVERHSSPAGVAGHLPARHAQHHPGVREGESDVREGPDGLSEKQPLRTVQIDTTR